MNIGILGGGQLARMLVQEAQKIGIQATPFCQSKDDPAAQVSSSFANGDLKKFADSQDIICFESEFVDIKTLAGIDSKKIMPNANIMGILQNRATQKQLLEKYQIPTVIWHEAAEKDDFITPDSSWVLKQKLNGYDGYGTHFIKSQKEWVAFKEKHNPADFIAERKVIFKRELALVLYRSADGSCGHFPLVEWKAKDAKCFWVKGPAKHRELTKLTQCFYRLMRATDYCGVLAVEMFDTTSKLYINEVAPRVHNSGHYTLNATPMNQFQVHLKCLLGHKLPRKIETETKGFAMVNLIGKSAVEPKIVQPEHVFLHWYGKKENRPGRKMGHLNAIGKTADEALKLALSAERRFLL